MKKYLLLIAILIILIYSCTVNKSTGSISFHNYTNKDAWNIRIGTNYILFLGKGQTNTIYFYQSESSAKVSTDGFLPFTLLDKECEGQIDLNLDYIYTMAFSESGGNYKYTCSGASVGKSDMLLSDMILMK